MGAKLGDPMDIKIRGYHLSLRREEAAAIEDWSLPDRRGRWPLIPKLHFLGKIAAGQDSQLQSI